VRLARARLAPACGSTRGGAQLAKISRTSNLDPWRRSAQFRQIARKSAKANLAKFNAAPRCGAKRKRAGGEPCQNPAMKNGRCYIHGGKTPSGRQWHVVQYPDCSTPTGEAKFNSKLRNLKRRADKRAARLATMTKEELAKHTAWHRTRSPGAAGPRRAARERRRQDAESRVLLTVGPPQRVSSPEAARIEAALCAARSKLATLEARNAKPSSDDEEDIFS
jgi:hypothetical protein